MHVFLVVIGGENSWGDSFLKCADVKTAKVHQKRYGCFYFGWN